MKTLTVAEKLQVGLVVASIFSASYWVWFCWPTWYMVIGWLVVVSFLCGYLILLVID